MAKRALIGYSGFVGGNLLAQGSYEGRFNSRNIDELAGQVFETVVCAGAPAAKWLANKDPEGDKLSLTRLADAIDRVECKHFVLISTIDVYPVLLAADETFDCGALPNHAYGRHRLWLEQRVRARHPEALVVRLPALFGPGLKKNILYDLLHDNGVQTINPASTFQWYGLDRLSRDIQVAQHLSLPLVNLFTEPVRSSDVAALFPERQVGAESAAEAHYDLTTRHAEAFGGRDGYVQSREAVLQEIAEFVRAARAQGAR